MIWFGDGVIVVRKGIQILMPGFVLILSINKSDL